MNARQRQAIEPMNESPLEATFEPSAAGRGRRRFAAALVTAVAISSSVLVASPAAAAVPGAPFAEQDEYFVDEDTLLTVDAPGVLANDTIAADDTNDPNGLSARLVTEVRADASTSDNPIDPGTLTFGADGGFTFEPSEDFHGLVRFTYVVNDGTNDSDPGEVVITVNSINDGPPVGTPDAYDVTEGSALSVSAAGQALLANDNDVDGDVLSASLGSTAASAGVVSIAGDGSFVYTPNPGFSGVDTFTYDVSDGTATDAGILVTVTVHPLATTTITTGPASVVNSRTAQFEVTSNYADATIRCALDSDVFAACGIPVTFNDLADGPHTLRAVAITQEGLIDATPSTWSWTVDATAPVLTVDSPATGSVFTQGQVIAPAATCTDNGISLAPTLGSVTTDAVGATFTFEASCTDAAGNVATATVAYSVVAPPTPPVVDPPVASSPFDVRWRSVGGGASSSLNGATVSGRIELTLTDEIGTPVGRDRSIRSVSFRIVDAFGNVVIDGTDRRSPFTFGRRHHRDVIDSARWPNGTYVLETTVVSRDATAATITSSFEVANTKRRHRHHGWGHGRD